MFKKNLLQTQLQTLVSGAFAALAGVAILPCAAQAAQPASVEIAQTAPPSAPSATTRKKPANSASTTAAVDSVDPNILFQLLLAEFAAQRDNIPFAYNANLELAKQTRNPILARRAMELASSVGATQQTEVAAALLNELEPGNQNAQMALVQMYAQSGNIEKLSELVSKRLASASDQSAEITRAEVIFSWLKDKKKASIALEKVLSPYVGLLQTHLSLANSAATAGDFKRALAQADKAVALQPESELAVTQRFDKARKLDPAAALLVLQAFVDKHPSADRARGVLAENLAESGQYDKAIAIYQQLHQAQPSDPFKLFALGRATNEAGQPEQARKYFDQLITLLQNDSPKSKVFDSAYLYFYLSDMAVKANDMNQARSWLSKVGPGELYLQSQIASAGLRARMNDANALASARSEFAAIKTTNRYEKARVQQGLAATLRTANLYQEEYDVLKDITKELPDSPELLFELSNAAEKLGRHAEQEAYLRAVIKLAPDSADAYNALGYSFADRNIRLPEARALIEKAINLAPDSAAIIDSMGWVLYRLGDAPGALPYLERAYSMFPDPEVAAHYGEVLHVLGKKEQALAIWKKANVKQPTNQVLRGTLARFKVDL